MQFLSVHTGYKLKIIWDLVNQSKYLSAKNAISAFSFDLQIFLHGIKTEKKKEKQLMKDIFDRLRKDISMFDQKQI